MTTTNPYYIYQYDADTGHRIAKHEIVSTSAANAFETLMARKRLPRSNRYGVIRKGVRRERPDAPTAVLTAYELTKEFTYARWFLDLIEREEWN